MDPVGPAAPSLPQPTAREKAVAQNFAAVFLTEMVDQMMKTVKLGGGMGGGDSALNGGMGGGEAEDTWRSFLSKAMADQIARNDTTGISASVERMLTAYGQAQAAGGPAKTAEGGNG